MMAVGGASMSDDGRIDEIKRLIGIYDADGTAGGEVAYFIGARFGRAHCALCDITHGLVRERADWREARDSLPAPFTTFHRNDQPPAVRALRTEIPCVLAETVEGRFVTMLDNTELEACAASPAQLVASIHAAATRSNLTWPV